MIGREFELAHRGDEEEYRRGSLAFALAPSLEIHEALLRGEPVPLERLRADAVARYGLREGAAANGRASLDDFNEIARELGPADEYAGQFLPARDFLKADYPQARPLLGADGEVILARGTLLIVYGEGGTAKSTWTIDGVAHMAAARDWLGLEVKKPVRFCLIENEGPPALFRDKLEAKAYEWDEQSDWLANVHVYARPWGGFDFTEEAARASLRLYCLEHEIDIVVANPLFGVGGPGSGKPEETQAFIASLKEVGLDHDLAFWLLHHVNKAGQVSGDWGRQPDTLVELERDRNRQATKLTWRKTRWATTPSETRPLQQVLEWVPEHKGFRVVELAPGVSDGELRGRLDAFLAANPHSSKSAIEENVSGNATRLRELIATGAEEGRYVVESGPRGAQLCSLASDRVHGYQDELDGLDRIPHG